MRCQVVISSNDASALLKWGKRPRQALKGLALGFKPEGCASVQLQGLRPLFLFPVVSNMTQL